MSGECQVALRCVYAISTLTPRLPDGSALGMVGTRKVRVPTKP